MARASADDYERIDCSTRAVDGSLRGVVVGALWGLFAGGNEAKGLERAAYAKQMGRAAASSAGSFGVLMGTYSGLLCVCERAKPEGSPSWHSAAVAGAGAGLLTSLRPAVQSRRPAVALLTSVTMAAVTAGVERVRSGSHGEER